jgi:hypothetical protein
LVSMVKKINCSDTDLHDTDLQADLVGPAFGVGGWSRQALVDFGQQGREIEPVGAGVAGGGEVSRHPSFGRLGFPDTH